MLCIGLFGRSFCTSVVSIDPTTYIWVQRDHGWCCIIVDSVYAKSFDIRATFGGSMPKFVLLSSSQLFYLCSRNLISGLMLLNNPPSICRTPSTVSNSILFCNRKHLYRKLLNLSQSLYSCLLFKMHSPGGADVHRASKAKRQIKQQSLSDEQK